MASTVTRSQSNRAALGCGGTGDSHHGCAAASWCYHFNRSKSVRKVSSTLLNLCQEELRPFWGQRRAFRDMTWHTIKYGDPYSEFVLCIWPIQSAHTHPEQWAAIYAAVPREQLGVRCLAQGHLSRGIEGGESAVHPTYNSCWPETRTRNLSSPTLTIRPQLPT